MGGTTQLAAGRGVAQWPGGGWRPARWLDRHFPRLAVAPTVLLTLLVFGLPLLFSAWLSLEGWSADQTLFGAPLPAWPITRIC
jgi:hypothetical protein